MEEFTKCSVVLFGIQAAAVLLTELYNGSYRWQLVWCYAATYLLVSTGDSSYILQQVVVIFQFGPMWFAD